MKRSRGQRIFNCKTTVQSTLYRERKLESPPTSTTLTDRFAPASNGPSLTSNACSAPDDLAHARPVDKILPVIRSRHFSQIHPASRNFCCPSLKISLQPFCSARLHGPDDFSIEGL